MGMENVTPADIEWSAGSENIGGTTDKIWFAPKQDFADDGIPEVPSDPTTFASAAVAAGSVAFKTGKGWFSMYVTRDTAGVTSESQGEIDGKSFLNKFVFTHPGNKKEVLGWCRWANNSDLIFMVREAGGSYRLMGSELFSCKADTIAPTTGVATADKKHVAVEVSYPSVSPAPIVESYDPDTDLVNSSTSGSASAAQTFHSGRDRDENPHCFGAGFLCFMVSFVQSFHCLSFEVVIKNTKSRNHEKTEKLD